MSDHEPTPPTLLDRREYLKATLAAGAAVGLAGCSGGVPGGDDGTTATGVLSTAVSDQPGDIDDFESCVVTIRGIWVGPQVGEGSDDGESEGDSTDDESDEDGTEQGDSETNDSVSGSQPENETDQAGGPPDQEEDDEDASDDDAEGGDDGEEGEDGNGRTYFGFDDAQEADLVELQGERSQLVGEQELEVGTYEFLQLDIADIQGTLTDGSEAVVETPGEAPLQFNEQFDVREGHRTTFTADFTPVLRGTGEYLFQPVASETEVSYEEIEDGGGDDATDGNESVDGNQSA